MHKALIIILFFSLSGCSVKRVAVTTAENTEVSPEEIMERVIRKNISNSSYYIEKANISININGNVQKLLFTCKFQKPGDFLISIKSITGIEGARVLLTHDTILINDRIGRRVISGKPQDIEKYTGIPYNLLASITGDYINSEIEQKATFDNSGSRLQAIQRINGRSFISDVDKRVFKIKSVAIRSSLSAGVADKDSVMISFGKFTRGEICFPGLIEVKDYRRNISAKIRIDKIQIPWNGELEFVAGKGYKTERIK